MKRFIAVFAVCVAIMPAAAQSAAPRALRLEEAVRTALNRTSFEDARLSLAYGQLHMLESLNRTRFEFRPQLGLLAFSNPALAATNIGASLLLNRRTAPHSSSLRNARFDVLAAELARQRARVGTELEATRLFFVLLERQAQAGRVCGGLEEGRARLAQTVELVRAGRLTAIEEIGGQQEALDLESACMDAEAARKMAALQLARLLGGERDASALTAVEAELPPALLDNPLPGVERLMELAMQTRGEQKVVREQMAKEETISVRAARVRFESLGPGYAFVGDTGGGSGVGSSAGSYLLGGHTGRGDLTLSINLRNNGEDKAAREIVDARIKALQLELASIEAEIREQVEGASYLAAASLERMRLTARKVDLARKSVEMVEARVQSGLAPRGALTEAHRQLSRIEGERAEALYERKARVFTVLTLCGIEEKDALAGARISGS